jgi:hypothetical protein
MACSGGRVRGYGVLCNSRVVIMKTLCTQNVQVTASLGKSILWALSGEHKQHRTHRSRIKEF